MLFALIVLFYIAGSTIMNVQLTNIWKLKNADIDATTTIHVMSILWPLTFMLTIAISIIGLFYRRVNDSK